MENENTFNLPSQVPDGHKAGWSASCRWDSDSQRKTTSCISDMQKAYILALTHYMPYINQKP